MDNDFIEKYKNDPKVKGLLDELKATEKEYAEQEKQAKKEEKARYREWYKGLSDIEKIQEDMRVSNEKLKDLKNKKRRIERLKEKSESQKERDARTHYLVQLGAELDTALKHYYPNYSTGDPNVLEILKVFLYAKGSSEQPFFPRYWDSIVKQMNKNNDDNNPISSVSDGDIYDR